MPRPVLHAIDRNRLQRYVTSKRVRYAISAAYSVKLNQRNLEVEYYSPWCHTFSQLFDFDFDGVLTVKQEYNFWMSAAMQDMGLVEQMVSQNLIDDDNSDDGGDNNEAGEDKDGDEEMNEGGEEEEGEGGDEEMDEDQDEDHDEEMVEDREGEIRDDERHPQPAQPAQPAPPQPALPQPAPVPNPTGRPRRDVKKPRRLPEEFLRNAPGIAMETQEHYLDLSFELTPDELQRAHENLQWRETIAENPQDATVADTSFETAATVADGEATKQFPDLVLCHIAAFDVEQPLQEDRVPGWRLRSCCKVCHQCYPIVMEIKPCPTRSRKLTWEEREKEAVKSLEIAEEELVLDYLPACFARDACQESVIAMSAAGPYWRWLKINRSDMCPDVQGDLPDYNDFLGLSNGIQEQFSAASIFILGTKESDDELNRLRDDFVIPMIEKHPTYPTTFVNNPERR